MDASNFQTEVSGCNNAAKKNSPKLPLTAFGKIGKVRTITFRRIFLTSSMDINNVKIGNRGGGGSLRRRANASSFLRSTSLDATLPKVSVVIPTLNVERNTRIICANGAKTAAKNWAVLFVRTGSVDRLVREFGKNLTDDGFLPFIPTVEFPFRKSGVVHKLRKPLFPGYIFLQTGIEPGLIAKVLEKTIRGIEHIYSILHYGDNKKDVVLREEERLYWERLLDEDFCVVGSIGYIHSGTLRITSGALVGLEDQIKKINRHERRAIVETEMMGTKRNVKLMLEIVEKS